MGTKTVAVFACAISGMIGFGCSGSNSAPPPDDNVTAFCADYAKAICQLGTGPCDFDPNACATYQNAQCMQLVASAQATGSTRQYSQSDGVACVNALNAAYGSGTTSISASTLSSVAATCSRVVVGTQSTNEPCTGDADCSGSLICASLPSGSGSVCASITPQDAGNFCGDPGDQCQGDSYCALQSNGEWQCVSTLATGAACASSSMCGSSDHCDPATNTCQPRAGAGGVCSSDDDCASSAPYCDTYPPAACTNGLTFARGSIDCNGVAGLDQPDSGSSPPVGDAGASDAPSGG